jgi:hypothetical protein
MTSFIGHDQGVTIVEKYGTMSLYPMPMKCYYHLHPLIEFNNSFVDQKVDDDNNLDILQMTTWSIKLTKKFVKKQLLVFWHYLVDVKEIKCPFQWWEKHETMFPTIQFLICQILGIVGSQIETKRIFSLVGILINLGRCCL